MLRLRTHRPRRRTDRLRRPPHLRPLPHRTQKSREGTTPPQPRKNARPRGTEQAKVIWITRGLCGASDNNPPSSAQTHRPLIHGRYGVGARAEYAMPQLLFKRQFLDSIRRGIKTTTLRRWKYARVHPGSRARVAGVGWLKILSCNRINQADLTPADARADGFASLQDLLDTLRKIYPKQDGDGRHLYRVAFRCEEPAPAPAQTPKVAAKAKTRPSAPAHNKPTPAATPKKTARKRLATRIRADLDKAVRQSGSLFTL